MVRASEWNKRNERTDGNKSEAAQTDDTDNLCNEKGTEASIIGLSVVGL